MTDSRRATPRTDVVLADPRLVAAVGRLGPALVLDRVRHALARCRDGELSAAEVAGAAVDSLPPAATTLRRVVNATGVLVHTNLGRAPLSAAAVDAMALAAGATDVELDLHTGGRGRRGAGALHALAAALPAAGSVHVVNNGAAALALVARGLAADREVVIARGELVEIGDGFRIPELLESVGVRLREVGTTNRVRLADYEAAFGPDTGFVLKVHPSNFVVEGFTSSVEIAELAALCRPLGTPVVADLGSGLLAPHPRLPREPDVATALADGADLVTASGDKLLGGPQLGLLAGRADLVERLRRHPMARALRVDKLVLAALEATLTGPVPPVPAALATRPEDLLARAHAIAARLQGTVEAEAALTTAAVGGGGAPGVELPSAGVLLPSYLVKALRLGDPPVVGHVRRDRLVLDLIAVPPDEDDVLVAAVLGACSA